MGRSLGQDFFKKKIKDEMNFMGGNSTMVYALPDTGKVQD